MFPTIAHIIEMGNQTSYGEYCVYFYVNMKSKPGPKLSTPHSIGMLIFMNPSEREHLWQPL